MPFQDRVLQGPRREAVADQLDARHLAGQLQKIEFTRLRTRLNFRGKKYYAEKEAWVDYPDPA